MKNNPLIKLETLGQSIWLDYIRKVTQQLEDEGVTKFNKPFEKLMETLQEKS